MSHTNRIEDSAFETPVNGQPVDVVVGDQVTESTPKKKGKKKAKQQVQEPNILELVARVEQLEAKIIDLGKTLEIVADTVGQIQIPVAVVTSTSGSKAPRIGKGIFGYSSASMLRWMGKNEWTNKHCMLVLMSYGLDVSPATIQTQRQLGRQDGADLPALTEEQVAELTAKRDAAVALMSGPTA